MLRREGRFAQPPKARVRHHHDRRSQKKSPLPPTPSRLRRLRPSRLRTEGGGVDVNVDRVGDEAEEAEQVGSRGDGEANQGAVLSARHERRVLYLRVGGRAGPGGGGGGGGSDPKKRGTRRKGKVLNPHLRASLAALGFDPWFWLPTSPCSSFTRDSNSKEECASPLAARSSPATRVYPPPAALSRCCFAAAALAARSADDVPAPAKPTPLFFGGWTSASTRKSLLDSVVVNVDRELFGVARSSTSTGTSSDVFPAGDAAADFLPKKVGIPLPLVFAPEAPEGKH